MSGLSGVADMLIVLAGLSRTGKHDVQYGNQT
jgi:hypothetical protein